MEKMCIHNVYKYMQVYTRIYNMFINHDMLMYTVFQSIHTSMIVSYVRWPT